MPSAALIALAVSACAGGQTGTEEWGRGVGGKGLCDDFATPLGDDELSPLGFSVSQVEALASGARSADMFWSSLEPDLRVGPEQGASSVSIELVPKAGSGRFVQYMPDSSASNTTLGCPASELRFDAELTIATAGGALSERLTVEARAQSDHTVRVNADLLLSALNGSLFIEPSAGGKITTPVLSLEFDADGVHGALIGGFQQTSGATASLRTVNLACWPSGTAECAPP